MDRQEQVPLQRGQEQEVLTAENYVEALIGAVGTANADRLIEDVSRTSFLKVGEKLAAIDILATHVELDPRLLKRGIIGKASEALIARRATYNSLQPTRPGLTTISRRYAPVYRRPDIPRPPEPPRHGR